MRQNSRTDQNEVTTDALVLSTDTLTHGVAMTTDTTDIRHGNLTIDDIASGDRVQIRTSDQLSARLSGHITPSTPPTTATTTTASTTAPSPDSAETDVYVVRDHVSTTGDSTINSTTGHPCTTSANTAACQDGAKDNTSTCVTTTTTTPGLDMNTNTVFSSSTTKQIRSVI